MKERESDWYESPLACLRSVRLRGNGNEGKMKVPMAASLTYSHKVDPMITFCRFELHGTCNDPSCPWLHISDVTPTGTTCPPFQFLDLLLLNNHFGVYVR